MAKHTATRTWLAAVALIGTVAVSGCAGGGSPSSSGDGTPSDTPAGARQSATDSGAAPAGSASPTAGVTPAEANSADVYELTETYTDPDRQFTVKYPRDWRAQENRGYLELTSPDGKVTGTVASTRARPPKGGWFTRPTHPLVGQETTLGEQLRTKVYTYSTYVPAPQREEPEDAVLWGLTESDNKGIVRLGGGRNHSDLWAEFYYAPVNEGNRPLSQAKGVELVNEINETDDAGTVDAILRSVRSGS